MNIKYVLSVVVLGLWASLCAADNQTIYKLKNNDGLYMKLTTDSNEIVWVPTKEDATELEGNPVTHAGVGSSWYTFKDTLTPSRYVSYINDAITLVSTTSPGDEQTWTAPTHYMYYMKLTPKSAQPNTGSLLTFEECQK